MSVALDDEPLICHSGAVSAEASMYFRALPSTHWSVVAQAADRSGPEGLAALNSLLARYRAPLLAHVQFKFRLQTAAAEDLLHGFCAERILSDTLLARADAAQGRFRNFLLRALDNYVLNCFRAERAQRRRPEAGWVAWEDLEGWEPGSEGSSQGSTFDRIWALSVMQQARDRMFAECSSSKRKDIWGVFHGRILGPLLENTATVPYETLIEKYGFKSPDQAGNIVTTGRRMFLRCLRAVIGEYAESAEGVESEIQDLVAILGEN